MSNPLPLGLLKQVSRSFYLSLRLLPPPMQHGAGIAYLLARASDTLADSTRVDTAARLEALEAFEKALSDKHQHQGWGDDLLRAVDDPGEYQLLVKIPDLLQNLADLPDGQMALVEDVMKTIIGGQRADLEIFGSAVSGKPVVIGDAQALERYTYRVAGCVGEFWTRLGLETLGEGFSRAPKRELVELAVSYGQGLQLVNILRDLPQDLEAGRCYLPVADPADHDAFMVEFQHQWNRALDRVRQGLDYSDLLMGRRLRMASVLPALLAQETLTELHQASWKRLESGIKIGRPKVYAKLLQALLY